LALFFQSSNVHTFMQQGPRAWSGRTSVLTLGQPAKSRLALEQQWRWAICWRRIAHGPHYSDCFGPRLEPVLSTL